MVRVVTGREGEWRRFGVGEEDRVALVVFWNYVVGEFYIYCFDRSNFGWGKVLMPIS